MSAVVFTLAIASSARSGAGPVAGSVAAPEVDHDKVAIAITGMAPESARAQALSRRLRAALEERPAINLASVADEEFLFAGKGQNRPRTNLSAAKKNMQHAQNALKEFDIIRAQREISDAMQAILPWIGLKEASDLDREILQIAAAIAHSSRDEQGLTWALREYALRFPDAPPPGEGLWPPDVVQRFQKLGSSRRSRLLVRADPGGRVFIDGRERGQVPLTVADLPSGLHRVEVESEGYFPIDAFIETSSEKGAEIDLKLLPDLSQLRGIAVDAPQSFESPFFAFMRDVCVRRGITGLVLAGLDRKGDIQTIRLALAKSLPPQQVAQASAANTTKGVKQVITWLFDPASAGVPAAILRDLPERSSIDRPVPTWAWVAAGAGLALVGGGIALRMAAVSTQDELAARRDALTQVQAYELRDQMDLRSGGGSILLAVGISAVLGIGSWVVIDQLQFAAEDG